MTRSPLEIRLVCWLAGLYHEPFVRQRAGGPPLVVSIAVTVEEGDVAAS